MFKMTGTISRPILVQHIFQHHLARKEDFPIKERAKKEVNVMTRYPPICIKIRMIICPICVKLVATSTVVSPVTHTEVVEINKASINGIPVRSGVRQR